MFESQFGQSFEVETQSNCVILQMAVLQGGAFNEAPLITREFSADQFQRPKETYHLGPSFWPRKFPRKSLCGFFLCSFRGPKSLCWNISVLFLSLIVSGLRNRRGFPNHKHLLILKGAWRHSKNQMTSSPKIPPKWLKSEEIKNFRPKRPKPQNHISEAIEVF